MTSDPHSSVTLKNKLMQSMLKWNIYLPAAVSKNKKPGA